MTIVEGPRWGEGVQMCRLPGPSFQSSVFEGKMTGLLLAAGGVGNAGW